MNMKSKLNLGKLNRRQFIKKVGVAGIYVSSIGLLNSCAKKEKSPKMPNVIFLLTDDQRWDSLGCMGNPIAKTPNIDRLASNGVIFDNNFVTTSICASSRASIFSGQYMRRHKIYDFSTDFSPSALSQTYPIIMRDAGYRIGFIGKWGVGNNLPEKEFDYFKGFPGQGQYFHIENGKQVHLTNIMGRQAIEFLDGCSKNKPFCLSISFKAPHVQDEDPRQFLYDTIHKELFKDITIPVPKMADPKYFNALPDFLKNTEGRERWKILFSTPEKYQEMVKGYYRLIYGVDEVVKKIIDELNKLKLDSNTIIILSSDNGFFLGERGLSHKWFMYEESIRTPLIIYDPRFPENLRGKRMKEMTLNIDIAPTILDLIGLDIPTTMQGNSLRELMYGKKEQWRQDFFYEHLFEHPLIPKSEGVRNERWKYIRYIDPKPVYEELYDLKNDPYEERNIVKIKDNKEILDSLRKRWSEFREILQ